MRVLCDVCEGAAAVIFCAADEAALCGPCDEKVHTCNKLASRHIRVQLAEPTAVGRCDICENSPAFFFCMIDGSSLCLECDMLVHVGGKRSHERYLLVRQKIEFLGEKTDYFEDLVQQRNDKNDDKLEHNALLHKNRLLDHITEKMDRCRVPPISMPQLGINHDRLDPKMIDLNARPHRIQDQVTGSSQVIHLN